MSNTKKKTINVFVFVEFLQLKQIKLMKAIKVFYKKYIKQFN